MQDSIQSTSNISGCWIREQDGCCKEELFIYRSDSVIYQLNMLGKLTDSSINGGGFGCDHKESIRIVFGQVAVENARMQLKKGVIYARGDKIDGPGFCYGSGLAYFYVKSNYIDSINYDLRGNQLVLSGMGFDKKKQEKYLEFRNENSIGLNEKVFNRCSDSVNALQ